MKRKLLSIALIASGLFLKAQTSQTLSSGTPFFFTSTGTGTYNQSVLYHNTTTYGFSLELAKITNSIEANPIDFKINTRGATHPFFTIKGATGNVGIGTVTPNATLQIGKSAGTGNPSSEVEIRRLSLSPVVHSASSWFFTTRDNSPYANLDIGYGSNKAISIRHNGNIGIGTTNPSVKLDVKGSIKASNDIVLPYDYAKISLGDQGGDGDVHFGSMGNGIPANGTQDYGFYSAHNAYRGNDGLWYHSRPYGGSGSSVPAVVFSGGGGVASGISGFNWRYSSNNGTSAISWTDLMTLKTSGSLGIGNNSPKEKLHVEGNLLLDVFGIGNEKGIFFREGFNWSNKYNLSILTYDHSNSGTSADGLSINAYDGVSFSTGANLRNERMRIDKYGNVGIGTTNTFGYKLAVNGNIGAKEVKVEVSSAWLDYVFTKEYNLPTLKEVAKHIKEKGHLPNIPSAKEVTKNEGIELGKMNAKLLEKIEELTLYTIQQETEIENLKKQKTIVEEIKKENKSLKEKLNKLEDLVNKLL